MPLEHHIYINKQLIKIVDSSKIFLTQGYKNAFDVANPPKKEYKASATRGRGERAGRGERGRGGGGKANAPRMAASQSGKSSNGESDRNLYVNMIQMLKKDNLLPVICFSFSKKKCEEYAKALMNQDLSDGASQVSLI